MTERDEILDEQKRTEEKLRENARLLAEAAQASTSEAAPFEPYCAETDERKQKRRIRVFLILIAVALLLAVVMLIGRHINFYQSTMKQLAFDYRSGETVTESEDLKAGALSRKAAETVKDQPVYISATCYVQDENGNVSGSVSKYEYQHQTGEELLTAKTGISDWFITSSTSLRHTADGYAVEKHGSWETIDSAELPQLYNYCFAVEDSGAECYDTYYSAVGAGSYICEIWLWSDIVNGQRMYYTLYRYFDGDRLAALRVVEAQNDTMDVYDITDYH